MQESGRRESGRNAAYVYAATLIQGRRRFALGVPPLRPPEPGDGWDLCAVPCVEDGLPVRLARITGSDSRAP